MPKSNPNPTPQIWTHNSYHISDPNPPQPHHKSGGVHCVHHEEERKKHRCEKLERKKERGKKRKKERRKLWREISRSEEERKQRQKKEREKEGDVGWCQELNVTIQCNGSHDFPLFTWKLEFVWKHESYLDP